MSAYAGSGVDIEAGNRAVDLMRAAVQSTHGPRVLGNIGAFGGLYDAAGLAAMASPLLVASTDGVGTKVRLAARVGRYRGIGHDIVNHCLNDILVQGARPLFFLDYIASARLEPETVAEIVGGMAEACRAASCALLGGETAEMPGVYASGEFDVAGTIVGVVERAACLPRGELQAGDVLVGLRSDGPHTNGYSLIRQAIEGQDLEAAHPALGESLADALLRPHRSYLSLLSSLLDAKPPAVKALAHLTGGGFIDNIPRVLPEGMGAVVRRGSWPVPPVFDLIGSLGSVPPAEMYRVFNMGIGMVVVVGADRAAEFQTALGEPSWIIGELAAGARQVQLA